MLKEKIESSFCEVLHLNCHHSLADYDFFDTNHFFPEKGGGWAKRNLGLSYEDLIPKNWPQDDAKSLIIQLKRSCLQDKRYHWRDVTAAYIELHHFGLGHMEKESFLFYFPAWLNLFLNDCNEVPLSSAFFFASLSSFNFRDEKIFNWLTEGQKKVLIQFLSMVDGEWAEEASLAKVMWESTMP